MTKAGNACLKLDIFDKSFDFNYLKGQTHVKSGYGAFANVLLTLIAVFCFENYSLVMLDRKGTNVNQSIVYDIFTEDDKLKFDQTVTKMAIGTIVYGTPEADFQELFYLEAYIYEWTPESSSRVYVEWRECTDEDWDEFYPIVGSQEGDFKTYKHHLKCLDTSDPDTDYSLYGNWNQDTARVLKVNAWLNPLACMGTPDWFYE